MAKGVKVGILMGSAYLFTKEIVESGAIVEQFQKEVIECDHTVALESGPGHASRCAYTAFAQDFFRQRDQMREAKVPVDEARKVLDDLVMGRLRIASKGTTRSGLNGALETLARAPERRGHVHAGPGRHAACRGDRHRHPAPPGDRPPRC
jgi:hypothetical protein